jgi:hypothetical protein
MITPRIIWLSLLAFLPLRAGLALDLNTDTALKCWLRFEEATGTSATDSSGNSHPGSLTGGPSWTSGKVGSGVDLAGDDDRIVVAHHTDLSPTSITVAAWINPDVWSSPPITSIVSKQANQTGFPAYDLRKTSSSTTIEAAIAVGTTNYTASGPSNLTTGSWQHVAFTYDGETLIAYVNGAAGTPQTSPSGNLASSTVDLWIGGNPSFPSGRYFDGKVDEFRFYSRALTAAEVLSLYSFPRGYVPPEYLQTTTRINGGFRND